MQAYKTTRKPHTTVKCYDIKIERVCIVSSLTLTGLLLGGGAWGGNRGAGGGGVGLEVSSSVGQLASALPEQGTTGVTTGVRGSRDEAWDSWHSKKPTTYIKTTHHTTANNNSLCVY